MAKICIIGVKQNNIINNLLTTIKVTTNDEKQENLKLITEINCSNEASILVYEGYFCFESLNKFENEISTNKVKINNQEILFEVTQNPRSSFLLQLEDFYLDKYNQIVSPFYSNCYLHEKWNCNLNIKNLWLEMSSEDKSKVKPYLDINLEYFIDKVGNVLKFIQVNEVDVSIAHQNDKIITLGFKINQNTFDVEYLQNKYIANIEVKSASDIILKKSFEIEKRFIDLEMQDVDDNIQIEVFNLSNNKCVYKRNLRFIANGTTIIHQVKKELNTIQCKYAFEKTRENPTAEIASLENVRKMWTRRIKRKDESEFVRFDNFEETEALKYLIKTLKSTAKNKGFEDKLPEHIYLADPYLFCKLNLTKYINIFNEYNKEGLKTIELRLIGCQNSIPEYLINELRKSPHKYSSIKIKSIRKKKTDNNGIVLPPKIINGKQEYETQETFHDRFIASKHIEYGFTNSINNLRKGVTFFRSFDIYFEDAEELWNISNTNNDFVIEEML